KISLDESTLPRQTRVTLAQLRYNYCSSLNSFLHRLDPSIPDSCPNCSFSPHSVLHFLECRSSPIPPTLLWDVPVEAATSLHFPVGVAAALDLIPTDKPPPVLPPPRQRARHHHV